MMILEEYIDLSPLEIQSVPPEKRREVVIKLVEWPDLMNEDNTEKRQTDSVDHP